MIFRSNCREAFYFSFRTPEFALELCSLLIRQRGLLEASSWKPRPSLSVLFWRCIASSVCRGVGELTLARNRPPAMSSNQELEGRRREPKKPPFKFLVPLIYAPVLPLIRISLKRQPVLRDRLFGIVLAAALFHGGYLVTDLYDQESK